MHHVLLTAILSVNTETQNEHFMYRDSQRSAKGTIEKIIQYNQNPVKGTVLVPALDSSACLRVQGG